MSRMEIELRDGQFAFPPGGEIRGTAAWELDEPAESLELRLFWYTEGKGDQDLEVVETLALDPREGRREFHFRLPAGPYSFSGKLISVVWAIELVAEPGGRAARAGLLLSPTGREVLLHPDHGGGPHAGPG